MHGCNSGSHLVVNAEVDSMGGVVDGGVGIGLKTSPRRAAIEKAQKELRQEYDVREERRRELDFLEKGGNPLDFKYGNAGSLSVQSTSLTDQNPDQIVTSEAKGSFALTPSPHGDSVDSSGRPGVPMVCEPNIADNLLLFDGEHDFPEVERKPGHPNRRNNIAGSEQSSQIDGSQNVKEAEDLAIVRPYARRNRSRSNRDGARSNATDVTQNRGSTLAFRGGTRDAKGQIGEKNSQKDQNTPSISNVKSATSNGDVTPSAVASDNQLDTELDGTRVPEMRTESTKSSMGNHKILNESQHNQSSQVDVASRETDGEKDQLASAEKETSNQLNGFGDLRENKTILNEVENSNGAVGTKGLDSQSSCTKTSLGLDVHRDRDVCTDTRNMGSNGSVMEKSSDVVGTSLPDGTAPVKDKDEVETVNNGVCRSHSGTVGAVKTDEDMLESTSELRAEVGVLSNAERSQPIDQIDGKVDDKTINNSSLNIENSTVPALSDKHSTVASDPQSKVSDKAHEDSILEEARIIEAKHKRIAELSVRSMLPEFRRKSHWDFVLEEMSWLANDFAQERLWKAAAAAQIGHRVALTSRMRFEEQSQHFKLKEIAHSLAKAVMQFWNSAEVTLNSVIPKKKSEVSDMEPGEEMGVEDPRKGASLTVHSYAVQYLKSNRFPGHAIAEAPATPDRVFDLGIQEISWEDQLTEENLFYAIPCGAMEAYRISIEAHVVHFEKTGSSMQEEVETSMYDAEYGYQDHIYAEEEGETSNYYLHKKSTHKKRKNVPYLDLPYGHSTMMAKRPADLNVGAIPTKRIRTASRPRVVTPSANVPLQMKTDASSGDTNSFQDDQTTLHGGSSHFQKSVEVESAGDFDKQLAYVCAETSIKPKKKKPKHLGSAFDQGWQLDSNAVHEQRDYNKKRLESHHFDSNGTSGLYMQHSAKKPKISKQSLENTFDNMNTISGSIPSPVASQSNMSNTSKFMKLIGGGRDRGRKSKTLKIVGHTGSGSPWSLYEDQALVVLVHDMGQNWEFISDAINSTLQFKCIFRKPKECKERHKVLMDKSSGDGADSAEDSGSSQPYVSTLPGIPKGSARQLFQRLQEPMEEDTLKSHFEKIIKIGQKQHYRRTQVKIENQDLKLLATVHNSHVMALSQVFPNNLNGAILTPLELSDATSSNQDVLSIGCQGAHSSGLAIQSQGAVAPLLPSAGVSSPLPGSSGMVLGTSLPSPAGTLNPTIRDGRYNVPRTSSLPVEDQQRMQQYNQNHVLPNRNSPQSSLAVSGTERGVRGGPGGNGMGMMSGMNRNMPNSRPAYQGMTSSSMLNSGSMLSSPMVAMPSPANMHSVAASGQGNSMIRPRDTMHMMRPGHNPEHQRQMMGPELQGNNNQGITSFNAFPNQTAPQPAPSYPAQHQPPQQHQASPQPHGLNHPHLQGPNQQAYAMRLAKERQLQQRYMQQQQQQFAASNPLMPPVHHPVSSQTPPSQPVSVSPLTPSSPMTAQHPQKHHLAPHGLGRSAGAMANQMGKQRQRPPHQHLVQAGRQHPQPRQQMQSQQQAKLLKGVGRGMAQNVSVDPSQVNGLSMPQGSQSVEMMPGPGQGVYAPKTISQSSKLLSTKQHHQVPSLPVNNISTSQGQVPPVPQTAAGPNHHPKQANLTQPSVQRLIQQNRQVNPDPPNKPQNTTAQAELNATSQVGADPSAAVAVSSQRKSSEPSNILNSTVPAGSVTNSSGTEATPLPPPVGQGMGLRQLSGGLPSHGHNGGAQWQPPQPPLPSKQSQTLPALPQQEQQKQTEKKPPQNHLQPQQQIQHLQAEQ